MGSPVGAPRSALADAPRLSHQYIRALMTEQAWDPPAVAEPCWSGGRTSRPPSRRSCRTTCLRSPSNRRLAGWTCARIRPPTPPCSGLIGARIVATAIEAVDQARELLPQRPAGVIGNPQVPVAVLRHRPSPDRPVRQDRGTVSRLCRTRELAHRAPGVSAADARAASAMSQAMSGKWRRKVVLLSPNWRARARAVGRLPVSRAFWRSRVRAPRTRASDGRSMRRVTTAPGGRRGRFRSGACAGAAGSAGGAAGVGAWSAADRPVRSLFARRSCSPW